MMISSRLPSVRSAPLGAVALVLVASAALGQPLRGSALTGRVSDRTGGVLAGARVTLSGDLVGGPRTTRTDSAGIYRLSALSPGRYAIRVEHDGFAAAVRPAIPLPGDTTLTLDFALEIAALSQTVGVTERAPVVDVTTASSATKIDDDLLQNLPTSRILADVINLAPGISASVGLGGVQHSNSFYVDGVDVSDPQSSGVWSAFNYNWVQEVQVVAVGAPAEYDGFSGVVSSAALRSGSNRFSGLAELWTTRPSWVGSNTASLVTPFEQVHPLRPREWWDSTVQLGGPLWRDRVWFFSGAQYATRAYRPFGYSGPAETVENERRALAKLTAAPSPSLRFEGFLSHDRHAVDNDDLGPFIAPEASTRVRQSDTNWNVHLTWTIDARTHLDLRHGGFEGVFSSDPMPPGTRAGPHPRQDLATGTVYGNAPQYFEFGRSRRMARAVLTHHADRWWGKHHELKFGLEVERSRVSQAGGYPGGRSYLDHDGAPYQVILQEPYSAEARPHRWSAFVQDRWEVGRGVTLEPGLRVNANRGDIGGRPFFQTNPVSPRLGVAWDVSSDHRTVVRAHYGRYSEALLSAQFSFMNPVLAPPQVLAEVVAPGELREIERTDAVNQWRMDPDLQHAYLDQWSIGIERELVRDLSLEARWVRRDFEDLMGAVDTGTVYRPIERRDPGEDNRLGTADDGGLVTVYANTNPGHQVFLFTNPGTAYRKYDGLQLIARKRYSRNWQLLASYSWSNSRGTLDSTPRSNALGAENGFNGVGADPNRAIHAEGPTWFDFTHEVKALGTYNVPVWGGVKLSGVYTYHTGAAWARLVRFTGGGITSNFLVRVEPRGSRRLPAINRLDLRLDKTIPLGASPARISIYADVFNVTNQGVPDSARFPAVLLPSGPTFGQARFWTNPRTARAGVRLAF